MTLVVATNTALPIFIDAPLITTRSTNRVLQSKHFVAFIDSLKIEIKINEIQINKIEIETQSNKIKIEILISITDVVPDVTTSRFRTCRLYLTV